MKKQITAAVMMLSMIAPAMANGLDNQAFEDQVFHTRADAPMQLAELSQKEMKETEGAFLPWLSWVVLPLVCGHSMVLVMQRQADQLLLEMLLAD